MVKSGLRCKAKCFLLLFITASLCGQQKIITKSPESSVSFFVRNIKTSETIIDFNSEKLLIPASTLKLVTTTTALEKLGSGYTFKTTFHTCGTIEDGILKGDLLIKGGCDPTLGSSYFSKNSPESVLLIIKNELKKSGIDKIDGSVYIDDSSIPYPSQPSRRLWEDMGNYYGASPSAITWRDNTFELILSSPEKPGELCRVVDVRPKQDIEFDCQVFSASHNKDSAYIFGYPGLPRWEIKGSIPAGRSRFSIKGAIPDPAFLFGTEVASLISDKGGNIKVKRIDINNLKERDFQELFTIESPPLSEIIKVINQRSHNLMCDHLFLALQGIPVSRYDFWDYSTRIITNFWKERGVSTNVKIYDGSGLSPRNLVSSKFLVDILTSMENSHNIEIFRSSLAIGGVSGTLSGMWQKEAWKGKVTAKSGSMEGVLCYAGYIQTNKKNVLAFSIMVNNFLCPAVDIRKAIEEEIGQLIDNK